MSLYYPSVTQKVKLVNLAKPTQWLGTTKGQHGVKTAPNIYYNSWYIWFGAIVVASLAYWGPLTSTERVYPPTNLLHSPHPSPTTWHL